MTRHSIGLGIIKGSSEPIPKPQSELFYPIMVKRMTERETKEYNLKKLFELSKPGRAKLEFHVDGSIWKDGKPIAEELAYWQKEWFIRKMKAPKSNWNTCIQHRPWFFRWYYFVLGDYE